MDSASTLELEVGQLLVVLPNISEGQMSVVPFSSFMLDSRRVR
jgi:hypothetical protein